MEHWARLAAEVKIGASYLERLVRESAEQIQEETGPVLDAFQERHGDYPALQRVASVVTSQCQRVLRRG
jgi:serine/threonine-protein kinase HipA